MNYLRRFFPSDSANVSIKEKLVSGFVSFIAILLLGYITFSFISEQAVPFMVASVGAAAVLVFAVPHSPLSQPWPVIAGHIVSAAVGVSAYLLFDHLVIASAVAVSMAIIAMYFTRSLHPPGGAAALGAVLGGPEIHAMGYYYVLFPIAINAIIIVLLAIALNHLIPKRNYPAMSRKKTSISNTAAAWALGPPRFSDEDLTAALKDMDSYIDISQEDLAKIYGLSVIHANKRRLGEVCCKDIMTPSPISFSYDTELETAWNILQSKKLKAAPVIDSFDRPVGIVTNNDFMRNATGYSGDTLKDKLQNFLKRSPGHESDKIEVVGQIMSTELTTAEETQHIADLIPIFTEKGFHHMPIVNDKRKVTGMITRSDVMKSMLIART